MAKPLAVLVVEDSQSDTQLIVRLLTKAGYTITFEQVETAAQMRAALEKRTWQVVISDYSLPEFDGYAALTLLQETGLDIPFIAVSGTMGEETAVTMMKAGTHDYVMKGNLARLVPAVERELIQAQARREHRQAQELLRESEKRFRALIENSSDAITLLDAKGIVLYDSPAAPGMLGYAPEDWIGRDVFALINPDDLPEIQGIFQNLVGTPGARVNSVVRVHHKNGSWLWIEMVATNLLIEPAVNAIVLNYRDITERRQAEDALRESEERFSRLAQASFEGIAIHEKSEILDVNQPLADLFGYKLTEMIGMSALDLAAPESRDLVRKNILTNSKKPYEAIGRRKDGTTFAGELISRGMHYQGRIVRVTAIRDISERKRIQAERQALLEIMQGVTKAKSLQEFLELIRQSLAKVIDAENFFVVFYNKSTNLFEEVFAVDKYDAPMPPSKLERSITSYVFRTGKPLLLTGTKFKELEAQGEVELVGTKPAIWLGAPLKTPSETIGVIVVQNYEDPNSYLERDREFIASIGTQVALAIERKRMEESLQSSEKKYRTLVDEVNDGFYVADSEGVFTFANSALARIYGVEFPQMLVGRKFIDFIAPEVLAELSQAQRSTMHSGLVPEVINGQILRPDGTLAFIEVKPISIIKDGQIVGSQGVVRDITERKQAEAALRESENIFRGFLEQSEDAIMLTNNQGMLIQWSKGAEKLTGFSREESLGQPIWDIQFRSAPDEFKSSENYDQIKATLQTVLLTGKGTLLSKLIEAEIQRPDGTRLTTQTLAFPVHTDKGFLLGSILRDITERKQAEQKIQRQLQYLTALSAIDRVIASNFDLKFSLSEILSHVTMELGIDATDILLLDPSSQLLEYGAERGFRTTAIRKTQIHLGESHAGRAALERKLVKISNLEDETEPRLLTTIMQGDDFVCYYGVPLISKGQVKGVLEIFHRSALEPDPEWFDFLNALAGQAAIAIENASLFESLQRSSSELALAYDATIEGWSSALDLRDKESEGHSQRVTELTVKLARSFGLSEAELVQVRWGALLHDIGKMGVPDGILLKPGPLTDKEWVAMKKHPNFAYEMLSPIRYLRLALDIPYCHHEKWDGSGYPRGLKGDQIPLVARIFAVVDVWDALNSDRPYRAAWPEEKVREHIRTLSGTHFDPQVVEAFMRISNW